MKMSLKKRSCCIRMSQELYTRTKNTAERAGLTLGETVRKACEQFDERQPKIDKARKILLESPRRNMQEVRFAGKETSHTGKIKLYIHENALSDIHGIEDKEKADEKIMEFMKESISDGTLFSKCRAATLDGTNIVSFRIHLFDVYCEYGTGQITILSVS